MWLVGRPGGSPDWRREGLAPQTAGVFPTALQNNKHMGQLTSNTWRADQPATRDPGGHELLWLGLTKKQRDPRGRGMQAQMVPALAAPG